MNEDVLRDIYDTEISVSEKNGYKVCNYLRMTPGSDDV